MLVLAYRFVLSPLIALAFPGASGRAYFKQQLAANGVAVDRLPPVYIARMAETARDLARLRGGLSSWEDYAVTIQDMAGWTAVVLRGEPHGGTLDWIERELREAGVSLGSDARVGGVDAVAALPRSKSAPEFDRMVSAVAAAGDDAARAALATFPHGAQEKIEAALRSLGLAPPSVANSVGYTVQSLRMVALSIQSRLGWSQAAPRESEVVALCFFGIAASVNMAARGWLSVDSAQTVERFFPLNVYGKLDGDFLADCFERAEHIASTKGLSRGRAGGVMAMFEEWLRAPAEESFGGLSTAIARFEAALVGR